VENRPTWRLRSIQGEAQVQAVLRGSRLVPAAQAEAQARVAKLALCSAMGVEEPVATAVAYNRYEVPFTKPSSNNTEATTPEEGAESEPLRRR